MRTHARDRVHARRAGVLLLALALAGASAFHVRAQQLTDDELAQSVQRILSVHCPSCRDVGDLRLTPEPGREHPPLDLDAIARDPNLVRPGNPEGSPVYTRLLRRLSLPGTQPATSAAPGMEAVTVLRAWIERLPASAGTCPHSTEPVRRTVEPLLGRQAALIRKPVGSLRVLTLAHLDAECRTAEQLAGWREAIGLFLTGLAGAKAPVPLLPLDEKGHHLAIDIQALGWDGELWRVLTGAGQRAGRSNEPLIVRADWLIVHILRGEFGARFANPAEKPASKPRHFYDPDISDADRSIVHAMLSGTTPAEDLEATARIVLQLARAHIAPAGIARVAAELGIDRSTFDRQIAASAGGVKSLLLHLAYGTIPRAEIEDSWLVLGRVGGAAPPVRTTVPVQFDARRPDITPETPIDLLLYADKPRYSVGDSVEFTIRSNLNCHLTVISIDTAGHGTVIFPNDFSTKDLVSAHLNMVLPEPGSRYRFRVKERGRERAVALCTRSRAMVDGIAHDFERQRFQELGPYTPFLEGALKGSLKWRAAMIEAARAAEERAASDKDRPQAADAPPPRTEPPGPAQAPLDQVWRTGIVLEIE